ncbi:MAG: alpha/beta fold hydrolase [Planctomycetota bacterium]|jgi:pimeloyl-ACP methyl ester carboxylesterase
MHAVRSCIAPACAAALVIAGLTAHAWADDPAIGDVAIETGTLEHHGTEYAVEFGTLWVPANRNDPAAKPIALKFVRYKSTSPAPGPPVVYLAGGPGGSGISTMPSQRGKVFLALLDEHDVIGFDQRGTGGSEPRDLSFEVGGALPLDEPGDPDRYGAVAQDAARGMLAAMQERGVDVDGLTTEQSADDLADLCRALGAEKLILWGSSYGTHLALATARRHPDRVASLILAGTEGPDHTFKLPSNIQKNLERLAELVREDPVYGELMPDLVGTVKRVLADLEANPRTISLVPGLEVTVGAWDLRKALSSPMGSRGDMQEIPAYIHAMDHGEFYDLARWAFGYRRPRSLYAMSVAMDCGSWGSAERLRQIERGAEETLLGAAIDFPFPCLCEVEGMPRLGDDFRAPVRSDIPALFISGTLDGRTPISNASEIADGFTNASHLIIRNASHGGDLFQSSPRILETVRAFLRGETLPYSTIDGPEWRFEPPFEKSLPREMLEILTSEGYDAAEARYHAIRARHEGDHVYDFREGVLNNLGYGVMRAGMIDLAIDVFRLNTAAYPEAFNTWDSLAEAFMNKGDLEQAVKYYNKSLELQPDNTNAVQMLERIREQRNE